MNPVRIDRLDIAAGRYDWPFARDRRTEIDAHFAALRRRRSGVWNGRVLLMRETAMADGLLRGSCFETDFASFAAWRDWGHPDREVTNVFAAGALRASDGAFLLGVMGEHTANAGRIYFPCGTPDPADISGGRLDLFGSVWREVGEETGLTPADLVDLPGWTAVTDGALLGLIKVLQARIDAASLEAQIRGHLAHEARPELAGVRIVRSEADLDPAMPGFVATFLRHFWRP